MSKFACVCGHIISDNTDFIPYKSHLISDVDLCTFWEALPDTLAPEDLEKLLIKMRSAMKSVYKCSKCSTLYIYPEVSGAHPEVYTPYKNPA